MDGASKFVRGDAIAAILITLINVLGGFAIGIMQKGMTCQRSACNVSPCCPSAMVWFLQIPALITSTAAGILVTRAAAKEELGNELTRQLLAYPKVLTILTVMLVRFWPGAGIADDSVFLLGGMTGFLAYNINGAGCRN